MDESTKSSPCKECEDGAEGLQLHAEVEHLRQHLAERDTHIVALEGEFIKCTTRANSLEEQVGTWREKYERLYDSHKRVQKLNQVLEDKLLQMVDKMKGEKSQLTKDIATLSVRLAESKHNFSMLQKENERYKNDMNLAIQLLQCKPDNFVSQKLDNLSVDTQARVSQYVMSKTAKPAGSSLSKMGNEIDTFDASEYEFNISASLMSKILEDSIQDTVTKHCDTCTCNKTNKPFCYNESYYSVATQTTASGDVKYTLCFVCNQEIKSLKSNSSMRSVSPPGVKVRDRSPPGIKVRDRSPQGIKIRDKSPPGIKVRERSPNRMIHPLYILPQPTPEHVPIEIPPTVDKTNVNCIINNEDIKVDEKHVITVEPNDVPDGIPKLPVDGNKIQKPVHKNNIMSMEPAVHHKLCDRTKMSVSLSSQKSSIPSIAKDELFNINEVIINHVDVRPISEKDEVSLRKMSQSSMGAASRTSSVAKSTVSTHKSNTQVGPGPRFCHLRMQAGSKNILLDNAEPDVPPVLYRRQSKSNDTAIYKIQDLVEDDDFISTDKHLNDHKDDIKNDNVVVESTLIDVHVDNNYKETNSSTKTTSINPVLLNVSSSPLQPLKTHNFSNSSENNNNKSQSIGSHPNTSELDNLLSDFNADLSNVQNNNSTQTTEVTKKNTATTPTDNHDVKIFNFDRYEQNKLSASQYAKPLRKIDMSQLHSLENTRISKDLPPQGNMPKLDKKVDESKANLPPIVNVYPNLTQTHLKVNDNKKAFTNEQSTSSLSSDDSAALLQKQQLLRVAEWVEKNLEQQNNFNDPLDEDVNFNRGARRDSKLTRLTETLNELALNMPHPVSKYSKSYRDAQNWIHAAQNHGKGGPLKITGNVIKETIFPVESGDATVTEVSKDTANNNAEEYKAAKDLRDSIAKGDKDISPEDLARMEYNVKKFLLSGPHWSNPGAAVRSRRTSSKTETDV